MEEYQFALAPDLGIRSTELITAWNADPTYRKQAEALLVSSSPGTYDPFTEGMIVLMGTVGAVGTNVLSSLLYDLLKEKLAAKGIHKHVKTTTVELPNGTRLTVVESDEES
jgi:hypothetical protein